MIPAAFRDVPLFALVAVTFVGIAWGGLRRPALGLGILFLGLPVLNQGWRLFGWERPFPSLETWAVALLVACTLVHAGFESAARRGTPDDRPAGGMAMPLAFAVFLVAGLVSALVSDAPGIALRILVAGGLVPVAVWLVARRAVANPDDVRWLAFGLFGLVLQTGGYALANFNEHALATSGSLEAFGGINDLATSVRMFTVPSAGMAVLLPTVPLAAWYALHGAGRRSRVAVAGVVIALALVSVVLSFSRGSWVAALAAMLLSLPLLFRRIRPGWVLVAVGACVVFVAAGGLDVVQAVVHFRLDGAAAGRNVDARASNYLLALASAPRHLLVGVGPGQYPAVYLEFPEAAASLGVSLWFAHSLLLTLIPEIGLAGALAFGWPLARTIWRGVRRVRLDDRASALGYAVAAGVVSYLVVASTAGTHLVSYLNTASPERTWFTAPALIVVLGLAGAAEGVRSGAARSAAEARAA